MASPRMAVNMLASSMERSAVIYRTMTVMALLMKISISKQTP